MFNEERSARLTELVAGLASAVNGVVLLAQSNTSTWALEILLEDTAADTE
jgi:hypothetical protein